MSAQLDVGSWGLFCGLDGRQLVRIDEMPCGPVSARKSLHVIPRRILLDEHRVVTAFRTGIKLTEVVQQGDRSYTVEVRPILSPLMRVPMAVLAIVIDAGEPVPAPPLVGGWEWEVIREDQSSVTPNLRTRSYWDRDLFRVYEVDPSVAQQSAGYWETGDWANDLLAQADQMRVNVSIRDGIHDGMNGSAGVVRCLTYNIVTGYGSDSQGEKHLRLVGLVAPREDGPHGEDVVMMRGVSYEVPADFHDIAFEGEAGGARVDDVLRGVLELSTDQMAVVDALTLGVLMSSSSWRASAYGHVSDVGQLGDFTMEQRQQLRDFLVRAAESVPEQHMMSMQLRSRDGSPEWVALTATGVVSGNIGRYAVVRLDAAGHELRPAP